MSRISARVSVFAALALGAVSLSAAAQGADGLFEQKLGGLEAGVQAEESVRAVKRLQYTYSHYLDSGLWSDLGDLFTDDAVGQFTAGAQVISAAGKGGIRQHFMEQAERTSAGLGKGQLNLHLLLQPIVTLGADGKTAKATWHEVAMLGRFGSSASWAGGIYENEYVRQNGVWKISKLSFFQQYAGSFDDYGHKAPPRWNIPYHFEAAHVGVTIPQAALASGASGAPDAHTSSAERVAKLRRRLQRLSDETEVQNLQHSYGYYLDRKLWDDVTDLFADDGSLEVAQRGVYAGKPHIRRALEVFYGPTPLRTGELFDHINLATVVTVSADGLSASARTSQLCMLGQNGQYAQWEEGTYENEFIKQGGVWKIKAVHYFPRLVTDYDKGWARDAKPAPVASTDFPPDRRTQSYESYPKASLVAFHYANPATGRAVRYPSGAVARVKVVKESRAESKSVLMASGPAITEAALADLQRALDAAIAVGAVENLNSSYGYYIDESAWDNMADTFGSAGSKEITGAGVYVGPDRIRKVLNLRGPRGGRTPTFYTIHQLTQPVIHISEDGNSAKARMRLFQAGGAADGKSASWIGGIYENTAFRENGEWKFGAQELYHIFNASYRNGWARVGEVARANAQAGAAKTGRDATGGGITQGLGGASSGSKIATEMPPDRLIRVRQYAFPEIVEPPFHYKNPVTGRMPAELLP